MQRPRLIGLIFLKPCATIAVLEYIVVRSLTKWFVVFAVVILFVGAAFAVDFPAQGEKTTRLGGPYQPNGDQQLFSGYVPPPPIRHTWPGGYKVIFHEMMNTLMDHIVGQY